MKDDESLPMPIYKASSGLKITLESNNLITIKDVLNFRKSDTHLTIELEGDKIINLPLRKIINFIKI